MEKITKKTTFERYTNQIMVVKFLGQGLNSAPSMVLENIIIESFNDRRFSSFFCASAFASVNAVNGLKTLINNSSEFITDKTVIVGVDQFGTSKEALESLLNADAKVLIYHTYNEGIFHPKVYIFNGATYSRIIVGSNNLTGMGLSGNDEASVLCEFEKPNTNGQEYLNSINNYFADLVNVSDPNVEEISTELINFLVERGVVPTEIERRRIYQKAPLSTESQLTRILNDELLDRFPRKTKNRPSAIFRSVRRGLRVAREADGIEVQAGAREVVVNTNNRTLLWRKSNLPKSDILYAEEGTNPTGGLRLTQAKFKINGVIINQTTYFRNDLWGGFQWALVSTNPEVYVATVPFDVVILGEFKGSFNLEIRHKPSGVSGQGNYTTSISWGTASTVIRAQDLRTRTLSIYSAIAQGGNFLIDIS